MKKLVLVVALFIGANAMFAQKLKVDLDPASFSYEYVELPKTYTEPTKRTFDVITNNSSEYYYIYDNSAYSRKIAINGFTRVTSAPQVLIEVMLEPMQDMGTTINTTRKNNNDGTVTETHSSVHAYKGTGKYIINYGGKLSTFAIAKDFSMKKDFRDYNQASTDNWNNRKANKETFTRQFIDYSISVIYDQVNSMYGYRIVSQNESIWILDSKENPEFASHQDAKTKIKDNCSRLTYNGSVTPTYDELKPVIDYFEKAKKDYSDPEDKKHRKMRYASYYNLMKIYYALDMFDKALEQANGLIANDYDKGDGELMVKRIQAVREKLSANAVQTTHLEVEPIYVR